MADQKKLFFSTVASIALICTLSLSNESILYGQTPDHPLDVYVACQQNVVEAIKEAEARTGFLFSYNPAHLDQPKEISDCDSVTLSMFLKTKFEGQLKFKTLNKEVVIYKVASEDKSQQRLISGKVIDHLTEEPIDQAGISLLGQHFTQTNADGYFEIKVPENLAANYQFEIIAPEYFSQSVQLFPARTNTIKLIGDYIPLEEVMILSIDPYKIFNECMNRLQYNYVNRDFDASVFFRELISKNDQPVSIVETVFHMNTGNYWEKNIPESLALVKGRKLANYDVYDSLQFKTKGSVKSCMQLNVVKYRPLFFSNETLTHYNLSFQDIETYDGQQVYVIHFQLKPNDQNLPYEGLYYITKNEKALLKIEFGLNRKALSRFSNHFVFKKPGKTIVKPRSTMYSIQYRKHQNKYILAHTSLKIDFNVKKKRTSLRSSQYATSAKMTLTTVDFELTKPRITRKNSFLTNKVLLDQPLSYDDTYWSRYTTIPLGEKETSDLQKSIGSSTEE